MSTDPEALPGTGPHTGNREIDPVTGYETTGHDWGGIRELNTPFPRIALVALVLTFLYSVIAWILLPTWPLGRDYTPGLLGLDQREMAEERLRDLTALRESWLSRFNSPDFAVLVEDATLMAVAMPAAGRLYQDKCSACHGRAGEGGPGYPALNDDHWLWSGSPEEIAQTLRAGINSDHPDTRWAAMPAFDWMEHSRRQTLAKYVAALPSGTADAHGEAETLFARNCATCHGQGGAGGLGMGAPSLADDAVIYGQNAEAVMQTLRSGRRGVMPSWSDRLSGAEINALALYVARLPEGADGEVAPTEGTE